MARQCSNLVISYDDTGDVEVLKVFEFGSNGLKDVNTISGWNASLLRELLLDNNISYDSIEVY